MEVSGYYIQVLSLGLIWVTFHCAGMCGPIIAGVTSTRGGLGSRLLMVGAYQSGRALTYAALGATAGLIGATFETALQETAQVLGFILAGAMILVGFSRFKLIQQLLPPTLSKVASTSGAFLARVLKWSQSTQRRGPLIRTFVVGTLMGFLPCMLMFWVLGIAASTTSALHGAGVMVLLVLMTTPTLAAIACAVHLPFRRFNAERLVPWTLIISGVWLALIAAAANQWIEHIHLPFEIFGEKLVIMLW